MQNNARPLPNKQTKKGSFSGQKQDTRAVYGPQKGTIAAILINKQGGRPRRGNSTWQRLMFASVRFA